ncbi:unnamed protein product [Hyaloperonospora brassicae]|uniref:ABC transporter domain-containing protein n=1 Tax=Hyaloperonospora brassicae TaxID=162125 RepID=A0AAV0STP7_HYABA|nr:unnamed protein product [Hyaloperonospora brassicae]
MAESAQRTDPRDASPLVSSHTSVTDATDRSTSELRHLQRPAHGNVSQLSSPADFGGLGTRQFLRKQLTTPGSATSASSFEDSVSSNGFSDAGTLSSGRTKSDHGTATSYKQMTKKLSSPSRASLARHLMDTKFETNTVTTTTSRDLPPGEILSNLVVKRVPFSYDVSQDASSSRASVSPRTLTQPTQQITALPRKMIRRVVIRRTGADGRVHEEVRYVDADGQVVQQHEQVRSAEAETTTKESAALSGQAIFSRELPTSATTLRRVVVRRTGADGQVHEEVKFVDMHGNVVRSEGRSTSSSSEANEATQQDEIPVHSSKRVVVQKIETDGEVHEEVQLEDTDGSVVESDESDESTSTYGSRVQQSRQTASDTSMHENSTEALGSRIVTRHVHRRTLTRKEETSVPAQEYMNWGDEMAEEADNALFSARSFSSSVSSVSSDISTSRTSRRIVTRRVVTPQRVVRRMVVRNGTTSSRTEADMDELDGVDAESVASEDDFSNDESLGQSSRGKYSVARSMEILSRSRAGVTRSPPSVSHAREAAEDAMGTSSTAPTEGQGVTTTFDGAGTMRTIAPLTEVHLSSSGLSCADVSALDVKRKAYNVSAVATGSTLADDDVESLAIVAHPASSYHEIDTNGGVNGDLSIDELATLACRDRPTPEKTVVQQSNAGRSWVTFGKAGVKVTRKDVPSLTGDGDAITSKALDTSVSKIVVCEVPEATNMNERRILGSFGAVATASSDFRNRDSSTAPLNSFHSGERKTDVGPVLDTPADYAAASYQGHASWSYFEPDEAVTGKERMVAAEYKEIPLAGKSAAGTEGVSPDTTISMHDAFVTLPSGTSGKTSEEHANSGYDVRSARESSNGEASGYQEATEAIDRSTPFHENVFVQPASSVCAAREKGAMTLDELGHEELDAKPSARYAKTNDDAHLDRDSPATSASTMSVGVESASHVSQQKFGRSSRKSWRDGRPVSRLYGGEQANGNDSGLYCDNGPAAVVAGTHLTDEIRSSTIQNEVNVSGSSREENSVSKLNDGRVTVERMQIPIEIEEAFETEEATGSVVSHTTLEVAESVRASAFLGFSGEEDSLYHSPTLVDVIDSDDSRVGNASESEEVVKLLSLGVVSPDGKTPTAAIQVESLRQSISPDVALTKASKRVDSSATSNRGIKRRPTELVDNNEPELDSDEHFVAMASPVHGKLVHNETGLTLAVTPCSLAWDKLCLKREMWKRSAGGNTPYGSGELMLDNLSGLVRTQEFLVITGPSKAECTALLSCLAGYEDDMEGVVTLNGHARSKTTDSYVPCVAREDLFHETLTVQEHLLAQTHLRMGHTYTDELCLKRVEQVMEDTELSCCRDKLIGGGIFTLCGLTRGERKLLAIATALLTNPSILFVEDPTDGLDATSAERVVAKLRWLAIEKGLAVVTTLHHPFSQSYGLFDKLYLVADASCVYDDKALDCIAYFSTLGYVCPEYVNPMDHFMLQMVVGDRKRDTEGMARLSYLKHEWAQHSSVVYDEHAIRGAATTSQDAVVDGSGWPRHNYHHTKCCSQLWLMWACHVRRLSRYGFVFWWHLLAALLIGVVFGLVYLDLELSDEHGIQNVAGSFFYAIVVQMLFSAYRSFVFLPRETAIALRGCHENGGGFSFLLSWLITKNAAELPSLIVSSIALFAPIYLLVGIGHGFKVYVFMQIIIILAGWTATGLVLVTLAALRNVVRAVIAFATFMVLFAQCGGLLIHVGDIPNWLVWLHHISPINFGYRAMMAVFWARVDTIDCDWTLVNCIALTGDGVLEFYSMESSSGLENALYLAAIGVALFFLAFWFLLVLAKKRTSGFQWRYDWTFRGQLGQLVTRDAMDDKQTDPRRSLRGPVEQKDHCNSPIAAEADNHYIRVETPRGADRALRSVAYVPLGWENVRVAAPKKSKSETTTPDLLRNASGSVQSGELVLITGPSRDSNVVLLECLGGLHKTLEGHVTLNGIAATADEVARYAVYVASDDRFYKTLTVKEHLQSQAQLLAGKSSTGCGLGCRDGADEETMAYVDTVLDELALSSQRHVLIQNLSKADCKLLAIATALLRAPSILLVEDPTCDLDVYSSQRVISKLRQLARGGRTVLVTMTHTSSYVYALFDTLHLLAGGAAIYHGKASEAVSYFAALGYQCSRYQCPVAFFVRLVSESGNDEDRDQTVRLQELWSTQYVETRLADTSGKRTMDDRKAASGSRVGCCSQLSLLFRRQIQSLAPYRVLFGWHSVCMIIASLICGLIFLQLDLDDQQDIQNWAGAYLFMVVLQMLAMAYRTFVYLPFEMSIIEREHRQGRYRMVCWYLTKVVAEVPATLVLSILLFAPAYLLIGVGHGFSLYFYMQIVMWLVSWTSVGIATLLLGLLSRARVAVIVYMLLLLLFVVFAGLLLNADDVPDYFIWLRYISPLTFGFEALMKLFWSRTGTFGCGGDHGRNSATFAATDTIPGLRTGSGTEMDGCFGHSGDEVLSHYNLDTSRTSRSDSLILLGLALLYFVLGYALLSLRWRRSKLRPHRQATRNDVESPPA